MFKIQDIFLKIKRLLFLHQFLHAEIYWNSKNYIISFLQCHLHEQIAIRTKIRKKEVLFLHIVWSSPGWIEIDRIKSKFREYIENIPVDKSNLLLYSIYSGIVFRHLKACFIEFHTDYIFSSTCKTDRTSSDASKSIKNSFSPDSTCDL